MNKNLSQAVVVILVAICVALVTGKFNIKKISDKNESDLKYANKPLSKIKYKYENCGSDQDPLQISALNVQPDPVRLPGNISVSVNVSLTVNVSSPVTVCSLFFLEKFAKCAFLVH